MACCAVDAPESHHNHEAAPKSFVARIKQYETLLALVSAILSVSLLLSVLRPSVHGFWHTYLEYVMALYFLGFGLLQASSLKQSAAMFRGYDPIAAKIPAYGYALPLIQIGLGISFFIWPMSLILNVLAILIVGINTIGVIKVLATKQQVRCGCLGTSLNVSVGSVTLLENVSMLIMATVMIFIMQTQSTSAVHSTMSAPTQHTNTEQIVPASAEPADHNH